MVHPQVSPISAAVMATELLSPPQRPIFMSISLRYIVWSKQASIRYDRQCRKAAQRVSMGADVNFTRASGVCKSQKCDSGCSQFVADRPKLLDPHARAMFGFCHHRVTATCPCHITRHGLLSYSGWRNIVRQSQAKPMSICPSRD